jgi:hypothetical protein
MEVRIFKLVNGDEVISEYTEKNGEITFKNPAKLLTIPTQDGGMGMGLMPWCIYSEEEEFTFDESYVIISVEAPNGLYNEYNDKFGPGIVDPNRQDLIV